MAMTCLRDEDPGGIAELAPDDPIRLHLDGCARCRARWRAYQAFAEPRTIPAGADPDGADERLAGALEAEILRVPATAPASGAEGGHLNRFFRWVWLPAVRPVWAAGLLIVGVVGVYEVRHPGPALKGPTVLRESRGPAAVTLVPAEPVRLPGGGVALSWSPVSGADRYEVTLYGEDLRETMRLPAGPEASVTIPLETVNAVTAANPILFWRVTAYRGGDPVARSAMRQMRLRSAP
jgi:hypothetical protein